MNAVIHGTRQIEPGTITNAAVAAAAAIAYSKLNLTGSVVNADIVSVAWSKITGTPTTLAGYGITSPLPVGQGGTGTGTVFTAGSVVFAGAAGVYSQDNAKLFWDDANNCLGVGTNAPDPTLVMTVTTPSSGVNGIYVNGPGASYVFADRSTGDGWLWFANAGLANLQLGGVANYLSVDTSGRVGFSVAAPSAIVHLKAGTATANTAPLKFTSGSLLASPEVGAVEFLTDKFYGTITTGAARKTFAFLEAPTFTTSLTVSTGATNTVVIGQSVAASTYNALSLSGLLTAADKIGMVGGGGSDKTLYLDAATAGDIQFRVAEVLKGYLNSSGRFFAAAASFGNSSGSSALFTLQASKDDTGSPDTHGQIAATGLSNLNLRTVMGYDTTRDFGFISASNNTVAWKNLILQEVGGKVGIGTIAPNSLLHVFSNVASPTTVITFGNVSNNGYLSFDYAGSTTSRMNTASSTLYLGASAVDLLGFDVGGERTHVLHNGSVSGTGSPFFQVRMSSGFGGIGFGYGPGTNIPPMEIGGEITSVSGNTKGDLYFATRDVTASTAPTVRLRILANGNIGVGVAGPTAALHLKAGSATAGTAPIKLTSGTLLGTAEAGALEFLTDDYFATITTGAARKGFVLDDGARLTSGKIPVATTNGRLIDGPTWGARETYTETNVTTDRAYDANATTLDELADVLGTLIADLRAKNMVA